jgi:hypothetical protein
VYVETLTMHSQPSDHRALSADAALLTVERDGADRREEDALAKRDAEIRDNLCGRRELDTVAAA